MMINTDHSRQTSQGRVPVSRVLVSRILVTRHAPNPLRLILRSCVQVVVLAIAAAATALSASAQYQGQNFSGQNYQPQSQNFPAGAPQAYVASGNTQPSASYAPLTNAANPSADGGAGEGMIPSATAPAGDGAAGEDDGATDGPPSALSGMWRRLMDGGPLMIPLGLCSLVVMALAVERLVSLRRGRVIPRPFVRRFTECVQDGQLSHDEALEICNDFDCPVAEVFHAAVKRWGRPTVEVEQAVMDAGERVADGLRKYLRLFHAVSNVAPLLGLLGTVLGMIEAFESLNIEAAAASPDTLASGISEALITTAAGLCVAIPAYLAYIYFSARADRYLVEIDGLCQQVVDSISAEGLQTGGSTRGSNRRTKRAA